MKAIEELMKAFLSDDVDLQIDSLKELTLHASRRASTEIARIAVSHPHAAVRTAAVDALRHFDSKDENVVAAILQALEDREDQVRTEGAYAVGQMRLIAGGERLAHMLLTDTSFIARCEAAESLGYLGDVCFVRALAEAIKTDRDPPVRSYAAASLGLIGAPSELLQELLASESEAVVRAELAAALFRKEGTGLEIILDAVDGADDQTVTALLTALDQLAVLEPVRATVQDIEAVQTSLSAVASRLPLYRQHATKVIEHWNDLAGTA